MYKIRVIESRKYFTFVPKYAQGVALWWVIAWRNRCTES
jgi:hypothetical protein